MEELVLYFSLKYQGDFQSIYHALMNKEKVDEGLRHELKKKVKCQYTTLFSHDYPESLKQIACPPFVLYYYGDLSLVRKKTMGVVGMRDVSEYGKRVTKAFVEDLVKKDYVIVSGMARGVDGIAHQCAMDHQGQTIAILGTGIEYCYPKQNRMIYEGIKEHHLLMSEYPYETTPKRHLFPFRNRIITGLSQGLLVCEAREKSGTMISVGYALEQGKDVYCVPSRYDDYMGCNRLIQQGAQLVLNVNDILEDKK